MSLQNEIESGQELRIIADSIPSALLSLDSENNITFANHAAKSMFPRVFTSDNRPKLKDLAQHLPSNVPDYIAAFIDAEKECNFTFFQADENRHLLIKTKNQANNTILIIEDISEEKNSFIQLAARQIQSGKFLRRLIHDIRSPLQTMVFNVFFIKKSPDSNSKILEHNDKIAASADQIKDLLLQLDKTSTWLEFSLNTALAASLVNLRENKISCIIPHTKDCQISGNAHELKQVVENVCLNLANLATKQPLVFNVSGNCASLEVTCYLPEKNLSEITLLTESVGNELENSSGEIMRKNNWQIQLNACDGKLDCSLQFLPEK